MQSELAWCLLSHREALVQGMPDFADGLPPAMAHEMAADAPIASAPAGPRMQCGIGALDK